MVKAMMFTIFSSSVLFFKSVKMNVSDRILQPHPLLWNYRSKGLFLNKCRSNPDVCVPASLLRNVRGCHRSKHCPLCGVEELMLPLQDMCVSGLDFSQCVRLCMVLLPTTNQFLLSGLRHDS